MKFATAVLLGLTSAIHINETPANVRDVKNEHINPDVYEVVNEMVSPTAEIPRKASAPVTKNDSKKTNGTLVSLKTRDTPSERKDVKNEEIRPDVYQVVKDAVPATAEIPRRANAPPNTTNGTLASLKSKEVPSEKKDVNNKEIRPDVYQVVKDMVSPTNEIPRPANPPPAIKNDSNKTLATLKTKDVVNVEGLDKKIREFVKDNLNQPWD